MPEVSHWMMCAMMTRWMRMRTAARRGPILLGFMRGFEVVGEGLGTTGRGRSGVVAQGFCARRCAGVDGIG